MGKDKRAPLTLLVFCIVVTIGNGFVTTSNMLTESEAMVYLQKFNYLNATVVKASLATGTMPASTLEAAISKFQEMVHIPLTGQFDKETLRKIAMPRCGVKDVSDNVPVNSFGERIWTQKVLSWKITGYSKTSRLKRFQQRDALKRAFDIWARETPLHFEYKERGPTDMSIKFSTWYHGDGYPFDGPGHILAHAYFPRDGNIHFDDHENWLLGAEAENKGTELYQVAAHEIGHALGLRHNNISGSLMGPYYSYSSFPMLSSCDIDNIQKLYGKPPNEQNNDWWFLRNDPFST